MNLAESVNAIVARPELVTDLFYIKYLDRYPDLQQYFVGVEMEHQAVLLKMALTVVQQYHEHGYPAAEQYLLVLGHKHALRQVPKSLYADWRDCLLDTLEQFLGDQWDDALEEDWTAAIDSATTVMHRGYEEDALTAEECET